MTWAGAAQDIDDEHKLNQYREQVPAYGQSSGNHGSMSQPGTASSGKSHTSV